MSFILGNFDLEVAAPGCYRISPTEAVNQSFTSNLHARAAENTAESSKENILDEAQDPKKK